MHKSRNALACMRFPVHISAVVLGFLAFTDNQFSCLLWQDNNEKDQELKQTRRLINKLETGKSADARGKHCEK